MRWSQYETFTSCCGLPAVGLDCFNLGQLIPALAGDEAQRLKLATEPARAPRERERRVELVEWPD